MTLTLYTVPCPVEASQRISKDWQDGQNCREYQMNSPHTPQRGKTS